MLALGHVLGLMLLVVPLLLPWVLRIVHSLTGELLILAHVVLLHGFAGILCGTVAEAASCRLHLWKFLEARWFSL